MNKIDLSGVGVALVTPFQRDDHQSVDYAALERLLEHCIANGVNYFVVNGTTAENPVLSVDEKQYILQFVLKITSGRIPVVFGIGGNNTNALVQELNAFNTEGVSAILSASPYYNKPSQEGIYQHYAALSAASPLPLIVYNVPGRTSSNISAQTTIRLAKSPPPSVPRQFAVSSFSVSVPISRAPSGAHGAELRACPSDPLSLEDLGPVSSRIRI